MFVLAIDTSSPAVTAGVVSLAGDIALAAERAPLDARGHDELLAGCVDAVLHEAGVARGDIGAVVAGTGPGPFTGLRVGLVTAAVIGQVLAVPTYGVGSLDAIGAACSDEPHLLVAADARRKEVYWARYRHGVPEAEASVDRPHGVPLDGLTAVAGGGGALYADVWAHLPLRTERYPDPVALVQLARDRISTGAPSEPLAPLYLRRPDAVVPGAPKAVSQ